MDSKWIPACSKTQKKSAKNRSGICVFWVSYACGRGCPHGWEEQEENFTKRQHDPCSNVSPRFLSLAPLFPYYGELGGIEDEAHPPTLTKCLLANTHCINHCIVWYVVRTSWHLAESSSLVVPFMPHKYILHDALLLLIWKHYTFASCVSHI